MAPKNVEDIQVSSIVLERHVHTLKSCELDLRVQSESTGDGVTAMALNMVADTYKACADSLELIIAAERNRSNNLRQSWRV